MSGERHIRTTLLNLNNRWIDTNLLLYVCVMNKSEKKMETGG